MTCADSSTDIIEIPKRTESDRNRQKLTEPDRNGQKQTETDRVFFVVHMSHVICHRSSVVVLFCHQIDCISVFFRVPNLEGHLDRKSYSDFNDKKYV